MSNDKVIEDGTVSLAIDVPRPGLPMVREVEVALVRDDGHVLEVHAFGQTWGCEFPSARHIGARSAEEAATVLAHYREAAWLRVGREIAEHLRERFDKAISDARTGSRPTP